MKILFIAHRIPYPPNKGDKIRSFNEIKYLSKKHEILPCVPGGRKERFAICASVKKILQFCRCGID